MMLPVISLLILLATIFFSVPTTYYCYLLRSSPKPWNLKIDEKYAPLITIIIPAHNEEKTIKLKLLNLSLVKYPKEKMQVLLIDDASSDLTVHEALSFATSHSEIDIEIIREKIRKGKSTALNIALGRAKNDIVIVSDADTFWAPDILIKALPFLSDPSVGAVSGRQILLDFKRSLLTQTENIYLDLMYDIIKLGESKIHSTIIFHGLFSAYKRNVLKHFNVETDDSGTALDIVQSGFRTIYIPGTRCYELPPLTWKGKIRTKLRRANQLIGVYTKCLELLFKKRLLLPLRITLPEVFIYLVNPIIFLFLFIAIALFFASFPMFLPWAFLIWVFLLLSSSRFRLLFIEVFQDNCILAFSLLTYIFGKRFLFWETLDESRSILCEEILRKEKLI